MTEAKNHKTVRAAVVLAAFVAVVGYFLFAGRKDEAKAPVDDHQRELRLREQALAAASAAPRGGSPCEFLWNYVDTLQRKSIELGISTPFRRLPERPTFLDACGKLPPAVQRCLDPDMQQEDPATCRPRMEGLWEKGPNGLGELFPKTEPSVTIPGANAMASAP